MVELAARKGCLRNLRGSAFLLGGSRVVISRGYKSPNLGYSYSATVTLLLTPLVTTHEPPSTRLLVQILSLLWDLMAHMRS